MMSDPGASGFEESVEAAAADAAGVSAFEDSREEAGEAGGEAGALAAGSFADPWEPPLEQAEESEPEQPRKRPRIGTPRVHRARTGSTSADAHELALAGAPHGTLVTASEQLEGRGRHGRSWHAPAGGALLCSLVLRDPPALLSIIAGVAVAELVGPTAKLKWPNDVLIGTRKVSGILVEGRPQENWAVLGIGINVALRPEELPDDLPRTAGTLGLPAKAIEPTLTRLLELLDHWLDAPAAEVLEAWRARDALLGVGVEWRDGGGVGAGIDDDGHLLVRLSQGGMHTIRAGEVRLNRTRGPFR
jgi:BirA family biotin operon repressor/biotin-[acetyl-CoA-carboxylase] ligase